MTEPHRAPSHRPAAGRPVPTSTYRLQVSGEQTFADVGAAAEYLAALGVTHAYLSPVLAATPGSTHGYDVLDHTRLSPDAGGRGASTPWWSGCTRPVCGSSPTSCPTT